MSNEWPMKNSLVRCNLPCIKYLSVWHFRRLSRTKTSSPAQSTIFFRCSHSDKQMQYAHYFWRVYEVVLIGRIIRYNRIYPVISLLPFWLAHAVGEPIWTAQTNPMQMLELPFCDFLCSVFALVARLDVALAVICFIRRLDKNSMHISELQAELQRIPQILLLWALPIA